MLFTKKEKTDLEKEIDEVQKTLKCINPYSEEYGTVVANLEKLYKLKNGEKKFVSPDTIATIVSNLLGIGLILGFERLNVITSKALGFVRRV
jgi:hypothetical protein